MRSAAPPAPSGVRWAGKLLAAVHLAWPMRAQHVGVHPQGHLRASNAPATSLHLFLKLLPKTKKRPNPPSACRPTLPEPPKLLPTLALLWPHAMAALADARTPAVEGALALTAALAHLGGGAFMARRCVGARVRLCV